MGVGRQDIAVRTSVEDEWAQVTGDIPNDR